MQTEPILLPHHGFPLVLFFPRALERSGFVGSRDEAEASVPRMAARGALRSEMRLRRRGAHGPRRETDRVRDPGSGAGQERGRINRARADCESGGTQAKAGKRAELCVFFL